MWGLVCGSLGYLDRCTWGDNPNEYVNSNCPGIAPRYLLCASRFCAGLQTPKTELNPAKYSDYDIKIYFEIITSKLIYFFSN